MRMYDIIKKKRDGGELSEEEISFFVKGYTKGEIPDEQVSALLMAIYFQKMTVKETHFLTQEIIHSGDTVDLSAIGGIKVDKHSTGGVGDKTSIIIVPIVAACGVKVAKMSGRGLGHTGGTVDKLESIEGYNTSPTRARFIEIVNTVGASIIGQSGVLAPADKKLYALRDVTATVDNVSLIAASIMGKKLASGSDRILLDIKVGSGAFCKTVDEATELAELMVKLGNEAGKKTVALLTDMDVPLGHAIGNSLEVKECVEVLNGRGERKLTELCVELAANMLFLGEKGSIDECRRLVQDSIDDGSALLKLAEIVEAHGGNKSWILNPEYFPKARLTKLVKSPESGYLSTITAEKFGLLSLSLGAGRERKEDSIDYAAGVKLLKDLGDYITAGDAIAELYSDKSDALAVAERTLLSAVTISKHKPQENPLIIKRVE